MCYFWSQHYSTAAAVAAGAWHCIWTKDNLEFMPTNTIRKLNREVFCLELLKTNELIRLGIKLTSVYFVSWLFLSDAILCNLSRKQQTSQMHQFILKSSDWSTEVVDTPPQPKGVGSNHVKSCYFSPYFLCIESRNRSFVEVQQSSFSSFSTNSDDKLCSLVQNRLSKHRTFFNF